MARIDHEIKINAPLQRVYDALTSSAELRKWHSSNVDGAAGAGGVFTTRAPDCPEFDWRVTRADSAGHIEWECVKGPGQSVGTRARFDLTSMPDGRTMLEFAHTEWRENDGNFRKCNTLWAILLYHLQRYLETGKGEPAF